MLNVVQSSTCVQIEMCRIKRFLVVAVVFLVGAVPGGQTHIGCSPRHSSHNCPQHDNTLEVLFQHEEYMDRYYRCLSGVAFEFQCPFGLIFDPIQGRCRHAVEYDIVSWPSRQLMPCSKCAKGVKFVALGDFLPDYLQCVSEGIGQLKTCPVGQSRSRSIQLLWVADHCEGYLTPRGQRFDDFPAAPFHHSTNSIPCDDLRGFHSHAPFNNHHEFGYSHVHGFCPCDICRKTSTSAVPCSTSTSCPPSTTTTEITTHSETPSTTTTTTPDTTTTETTTPDTTTTTTEITTHSHTSPTTSDTTTDTETTTHSGNPDDYGIYLDDPLVGAANPIEDEESYERYYTTTLKPKSSTTTLKPTITRRRRTTTTENPDTTTTTLEPTTTTEEPTTTTKHPKRTTTTEKATTTTKHPETTTTTEKPTTTTKHPKTTTTTEKPTTTTKHPKTTTTTTAPPTTTTGEVETTCLCKKKLKTTTDHDNW